MSDITVVTPEKTRVKFSSFKEAISFVGSIHYPSLNWEIPERTGDWQVKKNLTRQHEPAKI